MCVYYDVGVGVLEQEEKDPERARRSFCRSWCEMWFYIARSSERKNSGKIDFLRFST